MSGIESEVLDSFLRQLEASDKVSDTVVEGLRAALMADKLPKAEQLVQLFVHGSGDAIA